MKQRLLLILILALFALSGTVGWSSRAQPSAKTFWEYKVISSYGSSVGNPPPNVHELNRAGLEGWELVELSSEEFPKVGSNQFRTDYYLKRVK